MRKLLPGLSLVPLAAIFGFWARPQLPERVVTHLGLSGEPNGWSSPTTLVYLVPVLMVVIAVVLAVAPRVDPKRANFTMHSGAYWIVGNLVLAFLAVIHVVVVGINLGWDIDPLRIIGGGVGVLFAVIGNLLSRVRPNWVFGIRTPWTLSSERAWRETHRVGGYSFVIAGIVTVLTAVVAPSAVMIVMISSISITSLFAVGYSYFVWKNDPATKAMP